MIHQARMLRNMPREDEGYKVAGTRMVDRHDSLNLGLGGGGPLRSFGGWMGHVWIALSTVELSRVDWVENSGVTSGIVSAWLRIVSLSMSVSFGPGLSFRHDQGALGDNRGRLMPDFVLGGASGRKTQDITCSDESVGL